MSIPHTRAPLSAKRIELPPSPQPTSKTRLSVTSPIAAQALSACSQGFFNSVYRAMVRASIGPSLYGSASKNSASSAHLSSADLFSMFTGSDWLPATVYPLIIRGSNLNRAARYLVPYCEIQALGSSSRMRSQISSRHPPCVPAHITPGRRIGCSHFRLPVSRYLPGWVGIPSLPVPRNPEFGTGSFAGAVIPSHCSSVST